MASRQRNKLLAPTQENWIVRDQQCIGSLLDDNLEGSVYFPFAASFQQRNLLPDRSRGALYVLNVRFGTRIARIYKYGNQ